MELSQHWTALVTMPDLIVTIFDSSSNLPANLGLGGGKVCVLTHIWDGCRTQRRFVRTNNSPKISKLPHNRKTDKAKTSQSHEGS